MKPKSKCKMLLRQSYGFNSSSCKAVKQIIKMSSTKRRTKKVNAKMADQPFIDAGDPRIQDVYANDVFVEIGESEISLLFSHDFYANGSKTAKPSVRIILTHDNYMRMVEFWEKRAKLLRRVYMNRTPNLYAGDPEETRKAFDELYPTSGDTTLEKKP